MRPHLATARLRSNAVHGSLKDAGSKSLVVLGKHSQDTEAKADAIEKEKYNLGEEGKHHFGWRQRQLEEFKSSGMTVDHIEYVPNRTYNLKLVGRESKSHPKYNPENPSGEPKGRKKAPDTLDRLLGEVGEVFEDSEYKKLLFPKEKSKADDESAKRANIVRLRMERETRRKPVKTRRDSKLEKLFGHFEEFAKHEEEHQAEEMDDLAWKEAQDRRIKKKQERLESSRRRRRAENNLGNTGAYTDDHLRSKPQQVDKEVNMAQNVLNSFGGKILKVTGGTDPSSSYFQEMLVRGKELQESGWVPRKDVVTKHAPAYYNPWTKEIRDRVEHVSKQVCCDCGMDLQQFKKKYVFMAEVKKAHDMMIDCGKIEGSRRWFCIMCFKKKGNHYKESLPVIGKGKLKWYNPFLEEKKYDYEAPHQAGLDKLTGSEHIYHRRRGRQEREAEMIERRTKKYMRGDAYLPDTFFRGSDIEKTVGAHICISSTFGLLLR
jgi:hypothetical protein